MKVHWTATALEHLEAIHAYIARNSPQYALRVVDRLTRRSQQIAEFPLSGRVVPEFEHGQIGFPRRAALHFKLTILSRHYAYPAGARGTRALHYSGSCRGRMHHRRAP
ncbi:MAG: type II toxin-antitoxin system RelE/ParE family toxin [Acidobacteriia bacterium]|nr:type II toxin-antitoxin system RelE/ParE family toxin [Terriglobia bacterium]